MQTIQISNPEIEQFLFDEFKNDNQKLLSQFVEFVKFQKIKKDVAVSLDEFEKGDYLSIDKTFEQLTQKYSNEK